MTKKAYPLLTLLFFILACSQKERDKPKDACDGVIATTHVVTVPKGAVYKRGPGSVWYDPSVLNIKQCDSVVWENKDSMYHTATADVLDARKYFNAYLPIRGKSVPVQFKEFGEYPYYCVPHPWMKGKLIVKPR